MNNIDFLPSSYRDNDQRVPRLKSPALVVLLASWSDWPATRSTVRRNHGLFLEESQLLHKQASTNQTQLANGIEAASRPCDFNPLPISAIPGHAPKFCPRCSTQFRQKSLWKKSK